MGTEGPKDSLDGKTIGDLAAKSEPVAKPVAKKRFRKKLREIPECYFLPRRSMLTNIVVYGSCIVGGIGAGMLTEIWINKKLKEDGNGVIWEFK